MCQPEMDNRFGHQSVNHFRGSMEWGIFPDRTNLFFDLMTKRQVLMTDADVVNGNNRMMFAPSNKFQAPSMERKV